MSLIKVQGVGYQYPRVRGPRHSSFVLEPVSFDVGRGESVALLGPNGSGKTTLVRLLSGALVPNQGQIYLDGKPLARYSPREVARKMALVPQDYSPTFSLTVRQMVNLGRYARSGGWFLSAEDRRVVDESLERMDLTAFQALSVTTLSGGERRRVLLARALAQEPEILMLDEPTTHLDPGHQRDFIHRLTSLCRDRNVSLVAVLHDVDLASRWCEKVVLLKKGRMQGQGPTSVILTEEKLVTLFETPVSRTSSGIYFELVQQGDQL